MSRIRQILTAIHPGHLLILKIPVQTLGQLPHTLFEYFHTGVQFFPDMLCVLTEFSLLIQEFFFTLTPLRSASNISSRLGEKFITVE